MGGSSSSGSGYEVTITLTGSHEQIRSGMTAKCSIIIKEASDVYAVPYDAIQTNSEGNDVIYVKDSSGERKEVTVEKGMESDYYVEVSSDELSEGMSVIIPSDEISGDSSDSNESGGLGFMLGGDGGAPDGFPGGSGNMPDFSGSGGPPSFSGGSGGPPGFGG